MKQKTPFPRWIYSAVCGLIVAASASSLLGQTFTNILVSSFDTSTDPFVNVVQWWGGDVWSVTWDGTQNATSTIVPNNPGSGALEFSLNWTDTSGVSGNQGPQFCWLDGLNGGGWNTSFNVAAGTPVDGYYYDFDFDLKFDPASARSANDGSFGNIYVGFAMPGWSQQWAFYGNGYTNEGWNHIHAYIDPTWPNIDQIGGVAVYLPWQTSTGNTNAFYTNASQVTTFWLDNIVFTTNLTKPLAPPTLTLSPVKVTPGLSIQTSAGAGTYDRDSIATVSDNYSWVGAGSSPVTYSVTILKYPSTNNPNFQTQIFLASGGAGTPPGTEASPDWNEPNCIFLQIQNNADGSASGRLMWKTNDANANDQLWGSGTLGTLNDPAGVLGKWSLSFVNDTNVTLTSPSGLSTNWVFPDDSALQTYFPQGSVVAYFGGQPNAAANVGLGIVLSEVSISGPGLTPIDDKFNGPAIDPNVWVIRESQAGAVTLVPSTVHWKLGWTLPDLHFLLESAPSVTGPWSLSTLASNAVQTGSSKSVLVPDTALPSLTSTYFRMFKPVATQLQVLMPGETNAPFTSTGKTGSPAPQSLAAGGFYVTVNACDNNWIIVNNETDTVHITSTDTLASLPADAALAAGTGQFYVVFGQTGTFTVTASDVTTATVTSGTSSPTVSTP
ncbi:conserved exported hypothetical protein [Verrucomicrobia bacterium]|nr:conserved exported hypothetical protein [Verrucomicrobiota bacterium]